MEERAAEQHFRHQCACPAVFTTSCTTVTPRARKRRATGESRNRAHRKGTSTRGSLGGAPNLVSTSRRGTRKTALDNPLFSAAAFGGALGLGDQVNGGGTVDWMVEARLQLEVPVDEALLRTFSADCQTALAASAGVTRVEVRKASVVAAAGVMRSNKRQLQQQDTPQTLQWQAQQHEHQQQTQHQHQYQHECAPGYQALQVPRSQPPHTSPNLQLSTLIQQPNDVGFSVLGLLSPIGLRTDPGTAVREKALEETLFTSFVSPPITPSYPTCGIPFATKDTMFSPLTSPALNSLPGKARRTVSPLASPRNCALLDELVGSTRAVASAKRTLCGQSVGDGCPVPKRFNSGQRNSTLPCDLTHSSSSSPSQSSVTDFGAGTSEAVPAGSALDLAGFTSTGSRDSGMANSNDSRATSVAPLRTTRASAAGKAFATRVPAGMASVNPASLMDVPQQQVPASFIDLPGDELSANFIDNPMLPLHIAHMSSVSLRPAQLDFSPAYRVGPDATYQHFVKNPPTVMLISPATGPTSSSLSRVMVSPSTTRERHASGYDVSPATGLTGDAEEKREVHKVAEQRRRDSLKESFHHLKVVLPPLTERNPSKLHLLCTATEYIRELHELMNEKDDIIASLRSQLDRAVSGEPDIRGNSGPQCSSFACDSSPWPSGDRAKWSTVLETPKEL